MRNFIPLVAVLLSACAHAPAPQVTEWRMVTTDNDRERLREWRMVTTDNDRERLRDWRKAFTKALDQARAAGHAADIAKEGALLEPDAALGPVPIPNGRYKCRDIKLGAKSQGLPNYIAFPAFDCLIQQEKELQRFYKLTGSQRQTGQIFPADPLRQVFLGTLVLGDETRAYRYGGDQYRDLAGWVARVGDNRWRLILPYPHYESTLEVIELVPEK